MKQPVQEDHLRDLGRTIISGVVDWEPAVNLGFELGEIGLDRILDEGLFRDVPVLGSVVAIVKTVGSIRDRLFVKKVATFLVSCPKFTAQQREEFAREHLNDPRKASKLGDTLVLILDKLDDLEKPEMVAKAFAALVRGKIGLQTFKRIAAAIDIGFADDLAALATQAFSQVVALHEALLRTALVQIDNSSLTWSTLQKTDSALFRLSRLGVIFVGCMNQTYDFGPVESER